ncbi:uncharacterized protein LOC116446410 [Corvus moneduloides]|uniref:uncharacterized protein LOC116446410 n=1 Tax=Corvus moneduloides TaxID=1196302 RepID=UPI001364596F|nr:uncharacterized protein LOC116446410 [Corvus moneduloides]
MCRVEDSMEILFEEFTRSFCYVVDEALSWDSSDDGCMNRTHFRLESQRNVRIYTSEVDVNGIERLTWKILNSPSSCSGKDGRFRWITLYQLSRPILLYSPCSQQHPQCPGDGVSWKDCADQASHYCTSGSLCCIKLDCLEEARLAFLTAVMLHRFRQSLLFPPFTWAAAALSAAAGAAAVLLPALHPGLADSKLSHLHIAKEEE